MYLVVEFGGIPVLVVKLGIKSKMTTLFRITKYEYFTIDCKQLPYYIPTCNGNQPVTEH